MDKKNIVLSVLRRRRENPDSLIGKVLSAAGAAVTEQVINELAEMMAEAVVLLMSSVDGVTDGAACAEEPVGLAAENAPKQAAAEFTVSMPVFSAPTSTLSTPIPDGGRWNGGEEADEEPLLSGRKPVDKTEKEVDCEEETTSFSEADFPNIGREKASRIPEAMSAGDETGKVSEDETEKASGGEKGKTSGDPPEEDNRKYLLTH
ncbi:MAG: hypothetical protein NC388_01550 [Clostridium sp.]|nr:hypothetical protein [Clostridium sp.]